MRALFEQLLDPQVLTMLFAAIAAGATVLTLTMPFLATDSVNKRMKAVALERDKIRQRERERLALEAGLRCDNRRAYMKRVVDDFNLNKWLGQEHARTLLVQAGFRGQAPYVTYLFFRMAMPILMLVTSVFYIFVVLKLDYPLMMKVAISIGAAYFGMYSPNLFLKNRFSAGRRASSARFRCARSAADLRRIRHVDRGGVSQGQRGDWLTVSRTRRGNDPDDRGTVVSARPPHGL